MGKNDPRIDNYIEKSADFSKPILSHIRELVKSRVFQSMKIRYVKIIPYNFYIVLSQYFDYEHIKHVHPETLGEYRVIKNDGNVIEYEQIWPGKYWRRRCSLVRQTYEPPGDIRFEFIKGLYKGIVVSTHLSPCDEGTRIDEQYEIPMLPDWGWLRALIRPSVLSTVERIWDEDLQVGVCYDGWPGIPGATPSEGRPPLSPIDQGTWIVVGNEAEILKKTPCSKTINGIEIVLFQRNDEIVALEAHCPHTGGPLLLGKHENGSIICPWHGACFDLQSGKTISGPANRDLVKYPIRRIGEQIEILIA